MENEIPPAYTKAVSEMAAALYKENVPIKHIRAVTQERHMLADLITGIVNSERHAAQAGETPGPHTGPWDIGEKELTAFMEYSLRNQAPPLRRLVRSKWREGLFDLTPEQLLKIRDLRPPKGKRIARVPQYYDFNEADEHVREWTRGLYLTHQMRLARIRRNRILLADETIARHCDTRLLLALERAGLVYAVALEEFTQDDILSMRQFGPSSLDHFKAFMAAIEPRLKVNRK